MRELTTAAAVLAAAVAATAPADEIHLKSGGKVSGRIVSRTAESIEVDVGAGKITVPTSHVVRVEEKRSALHEYEEKASRLPAGDADAWIALGDWASAMGLGTQAREAYNRALAAAPGDPRANAGVGNVQVDGRWVSEDEGYKAKGYVKYQGQWMAPVEHQALLAQEAAEAQNERMRQEADMRVREAEARASEAEAAARQAEADAAAAQQDQGIPLWYGWGAGPVAWPTGPVIAPSRPVARPVRVR
jgi:hypothetical protein